MPERGNAGQISLELVIKSKVEAQLEAMKSKLTAAAAKIGDEMSRRLSEAFNADGIKLPEIRLPDTVTPKIPEPDTSVVAQALDKINEKIGQMFERLGEFRLPEDSFRALTAGLDNVCQKLDLMQKKWQEAATLPAPDLPVSAPELERIKALLEEICAKIGELAGTKVTPEVDGRKAEKALDRIKAKTGITASAIRSKLGGAFSTVNRLCSKAANGLKKSFGGLTAPVDRLGKSLKRTFKSVFLMAGVYAAFRAVKDGLLQAAKADEAFSRSLNEVKANLAIAFTPILQAIMPALNTLMSGLAAATKAVAGFIAGLFGTTYKKAAEATKKLKSTSDAAKKAQLSMAGIDEMNVLSDSDSGSSGGGADYSQLDMTEPELPDWAERLKDSIRSGDWAGVGKILAERINSAFGAINWDAVSAKVNSGVKKITDGINAFVDALDWGTVGDTIAGGINTAFGAIYTF